MGGIEIAFFILYGAVMTGAYFLLKWLLNDVGFWTIIPWAAFFLFVAWKIDQRDKRRTPQ